MDKRVIEKEKIYLARSYRHLLLDKKQCILFLIFIVLPALLMMIFGCGKLSKLIAEITSKILNVVEPGIEISYRWNLFVPGLEPLKSIAFDTPYPGNNFILINILVSLLIIVVLRIIKKKSSPIAIYLLINVVIHLINSLFFLFAENRFPYTVADYSELYMNQQIGIWIFFILIAGVVLGLLGRGQLFFRIGIFLSIMSYSLLFGILRYTIFLLIIYNFSVIYMAVFFFTLGPFYDFLYLVAFYAIYINKMVSVYSFGKGKEEWKWS